MAKEAQTNFTTESIHLIQIAHRDYPSSAVLQEYVTVTHRLRASDVCVIPDSIQLTTIHVWLDRAPRQDTPSCTVIQGGEYGPSRTVPNLGRQLGDSQSIPKLGKGTTREKKGRGAKREYKKALLSHCCSCSKHHLSSQFTHCKDPRYIQPCVTTTRPPLWSVTTAQAW